MWYLFQHNNSSAGFGVFTRRKGNLSGVVVCDGVEGLGTIYV